MLGDGKIERTGRLLLFRRIIASIFLFFAFAAGIALKQVGAAKYGYDYDLNPLFANIGGMTTQELIAEMKYAVKMRNGGKYYPQSRIEQIEKQLAENQKAELERYKEQLKKEAEVAKKVEDLKEAAIEKAKAMGENYYEEHKEEIQQKVEEQARKMLGMTEAEWIVNKEKITEMYEKGSEAYKEHLSGYVEAARKAFDAYNAYKQAKSDNPEAPEAAQNLVGFLNATKEVLTFAGEKMQDTPLRPIGEILNAYGEAASLGDTAAKAAWKCIHHDDINPNFKTQYSEGLDKIGLDDFGPVEKTSLMRFDADMKVLHVGNGKYAAFDENFKLVQIGGRDTLNKDEFERLQQMYVAYENGKKDGWPKLKIEDFLKLANGETIKVKVEDNWFSKDKYREFAAGDIMDLGHRHMKNVLGDELTRSIDRIVNGEQGVLDKILDPFTRSSRNREINEAYGKYLDSLDSTRDKSEIHLKESFLEYIKRLKDENPNIKMKDIIEKLKEEIDRKKSKEPDKDKTKEKEPGKPQGKPDKEKKNPLVDRIRKIDPKAKDADSSGIKKDNAGLSSDKKKHWTERTPENFNGQKDSGFTKIGTTYRAIPDPNKLSIPVLKPNIYLYPQHAQKIEVKFKTPEKLTASIPSYSSGWTVFAGPDGKLEGGRYDYLFYEADVEEIYFQKSVAWKLPAKERKRAFEEILDAYGFNSGEKRDFIEFWDKKIDADKQYLVYPQETALVERAMPFDITPVPDRIYRIWFYFIASEDEPVRPPAAVERIKRNGFTVVEWGGMVR